MSKMIELKNKEIATIKSSLDVLCQEKLPCSVGLGINKRRFTEISDKYTDELKEIRDKYCILDEGIFGYKLKSDVKGKPAMHVNFEDFDAGEKQEEYEDLIEAKINEVVQVNIHQIDLNRMVSNKKGDKEVTLEDKIEYEYDIEARLIEPLIEIIFVHK